MKHGPIEPAGNNGGCRAHSDFERMARDNGERVEARGEKQRHKQERGTPHLHTMQDHKNCGEDRDQRQSALQPFQPTPPHKIGVHSDRFLGPIL